MAAAAGAGAGAAGPGALKAIIPAFSITDAISRSEFDQALRYLTNEKDDEVVKRQLAQFAKPCYGDGEKNAVRCLQPISLPSLSLALSLSLPLERSILSLSLSLSL
jgi:hypothetical protein